MALEVGQKLRRRQPANDCWDEIVISGWFDCRETQELVLTPSLGFAAPIMATPESVIGAYTIDVDGPPPLPKTWKTPIEEVTA